MSEAEQGLTEFTQDNIRSNPKHKGQMLRVWHDYLKTQREQDHRELKHIKRKISNLKYNSNPNNEAKKKVYYREYRRKKKIEKLNLMLQINNQTIIQQDKQEEYIKMSITEDKNSTELRIIVDSNISFNFRIPLEMDLITLRGVMMKLNDITKRFKVDLGINSSGASVELPHRTYNPENKGLYSMNGWSDNEIKTLLDNYNPTESGNVLKISRLMNRPTNTIYRKISQLKDSGILTRPNNKMSSTYNEDEKLKSIDEMMELVKNNGEQD